MLTTGGAQKTDAVKNMSDADSVGRHSLILTTSTNTVGATCRGRASTQTEPPLRHDRDVDDFTMNNNCRAARISALVEPSAPVVARRCACHLSMYSTTGRGMCVRDRECGRHIHNNRIVSSHRKGPLRTWWAAHSEASGPHCVGGDWRLDDRHCCSWEDCW